MCKPTLSATNYDGSFFSLRCVRLARFENDRTISFIPPDGSFDLMTYRLSTQVSFPQCNLFFITTKDCNFYHITILITQVKPLIWVEAQVERHSRSRIEIMVKARSQFKERRYCRLCVAFSFYFYEIFSVVDSYLSFFCIAALQQMLKLSSLYLQMLPILMCAPPWDLLHMHLRMMLQFGKLNLFPGARYTLKLFLIYVINNPMLLFYDLNQKPICLAKYVISHVFSMFAKLNFRNIC